MLKRFVVGLLTTAAAVTVWTLATLNPGQSHWTLASSRAEVREQIRETPLLERPNRAGHFYGNSVRRLHHLRTGA